MRFSHWQKNLIPQQRHAFFVGQFQVNLDELKAGSFYARARVGSKWHGIRVIIQKK